MGIVRAVLKWAGVALLLATAACWLLPEEWPESRNVDLRAAAGTEGQAPRVPMRDLLWSADGETMLMRVLGETGTSNALLGFRQGDDFVFRPLTTDSRTLWRLALFSDASAAICVDESGNVDRFDLRTSEWTRLQTISRGRWTSALAVSADGSTVAIGAEHEVLLCDAQTGALLGTLPCPQTLNLVFCGADRWLVTTAGNGAIHIWDGMTDEPALTLTGHQGQVRGVCCLPGDSLLVSVGVDDTIRLWDLLSGELLWQRSAEKTGVESLTISIDGRLAATGGYDRRIRLWDLDEGVPTATFSGHRGIVRSMRFSADGKVLTSASQDGTIREWELNSNQPGRIVYR